MSAENAPERITRWECPEHGADSGPGKRCGQMARPYVLCHREKVEVEYVRADLADRAMTLLSELRLRRGNPRAVARTMEGVVEFLTHDWRGDQ